MIHFQVRDAPLRAEAERDPEHRVLGPSDQRVPLRAARRVRVERRQEKRPCR